MKVLILAPLCTHPPTQGNRQRILALTGMLQQLGHEVHFALLRNERFGAGDIDATHAYWGERFHELAQFEDWTPGMRIRRQLARVMRPAALRLAGLANTRQRLDDVDEIYFDWWTVELIRLQRAHRFDVVVAEYIFTTAGFEAFPVTVRRLVDTHDLFSERNEVVRRQTNREYTWVSATPRTEGIGLGRADVALGIQDDESRKLRELYGGNVVTVGHPIQQRPPQSNPPVPNTVIFVGSSNVLNIQGVQWFLDEVLPLAVASNPAVRLRLVGDIGSHVAVPDSLRPTVDIAGRVDDLDDEYARASVVINPVLFGTGLAIKSIEAIEYAKPLLCTSMGARGLPALGTARQPLLVADTADDFATQLNDLLSNAQAREALSAACAAYRSRWNDEQIANLEHALGTAPHPAASRAASASANP